MYTSAELASMILAHAKKLAETKAQSQIQDIVLTVPQHYDMNQWVMMQEAAELANLWVLAMVHQNTAAALAHGVDRLDDEEYIVMFINLGATSFELSLVKFYTTLKDDEKKIETIEVIDEENVQGHGGWSFDIALVELMADHFNAQANRKGMDDVRNKPRAMRRLIKEVSNIKDVLSANKEVNVKIPELSDYIDL